MTCGPSFRSCSGTASSLRPSMSCAVPRSPMPLSSRFWTGCRRRADCRPSMRAPQEFHYRLPNRVRGQRPGSHAGLAIGTGQEFVSHASLYERPDPRRLDLRASLRSLRDEWLVRVNRQRSGVTVYAVVDSSASMGFGAGAKRESVGEFLESLGLSAFRAGDSVGLLAFDSREQPELFVPPRLGRGVGSSLRERLEQFWAERSRVGRTKPGAADAASTAGG